jgi:amino acid transporter
MSTEDKVVASSTDASAAGEPHLRGRMGVVEVAFTVLAFAAPLTGAWGYLPFIILFAGIGAPLAVLIAMVLLLIFSVGFVKMSRSIDNPGAFYAFVAVGINRSTGLAGAFLATAAYLLLLAGVSSFFGIVSSALIADLSGGFAVPWYVLGLALLVIVAVFGSLGIEVSAKTLSFFLVIEVILVLAFDVVVLGRGGPEGRPLEPWGWNALTHGNMAVGLVFAIVMFIGFEATAVFREEARDPDKTIPRATYLSVGFIGVFNAVTVWLLIVATGVGASVALAESDPTSMFPTAFGNYLGTAMKDVATVLVLTSVFASSLSIHNVFARYMYNLGVDGALPRVLGKVHPKQGSPYIASLTAGAVAIVIVVLVVVFGLDPGVFYGRAAGVGSLCLMVLMVLTMVAVVLFFRRRGTSASDSAWSTLIAPAIAGLGLLAVIALTLANANDFMGTTTGLSITFIAGIAALFVAGLVVAQRIKATRPDVYARLGRQSEGSGS